jgi:hypothetical protein
MGLKVAHSPGGDPQVVRGLGQVEEPRHGSPRHWCASGLVVPLVALHSCEIGACGLGLSRAPWPSAQV